MNRYREAFEAWRLQWLRRELVKARGSVRLMAKANGMHRGAAYKLCAKAGMRFSGDVVHAWTERRPVRGAHGRFVERRPSNHCA